MGANDQIFSANTNDQMIFGQEMVCMLSVTLIAVTLHWTMTNFKKDYILRASHSMRIPCLLSMVSFLTMNIVGMIGWNNVFIPITDVSCKIAYPFCLFSYNCGNIAMYYLFTYRIELIYRHTSYEISAHLLHIYRILCCVIPNILCCLYLYTAWDDITPHWTDSPNARYQYCFPLKFRYNPMIYAMAVISVLLSAYPLLLFVAKYAKVTALYRRAKIINNQKSGDLYMKMGESLANNLPGFEAKHIAIIRKSTMIVCIAVVTTWVYIIGQAYVLRQFGFFSPFDGVINALAMACLFQSGDDFYSISFQKLECFLGFGYYCNVCPCDCCGDLYDYNEGSESGNNGTVQVLAEEPVIKDIILDKTTLEYHAKIHSHTNKGANSGVGTQPIRINITTPTQRYQHSIEARNVLFGGPASITEFKPLNLNENNNIENTEIESISQRGNTHIINNEYSVETNDLYK